MKITQAYLNNGSVQIASKGKLYIWGEQTLPKGYYRLDCFVDCALMTTQSIKGIKNVRTFVADFLEMWQESDIELSPYYDTGNTMDYEDMVKLSFKTITRNHDFKVIGDDVCPDKLFCNIIKAALSDPSFNIWNNLFLCNVIKDLKMFKVKEKLQAVERIALLLNKGEGTGDTTGRPNTLKGFLIRETNLVTTFEAKKVWFDTLVKIIENDY